uniref:Uncharacterized protein n=1 Tax=Angiostrongylus cantonensis TaxID=6313 RepID=A0A0K0D974_ANGCA
MDDEDPVKMRLNEGVKLYNLDDFMKNRVQMMEGIDLSIPTLSNASVRQYYNSDLSMEQRSLMLAWASAEYPKSGTVNGFEEYSTRSCVPSELNGKFTWNFVSSTKFALQSKQRQGNESKNERSEENQLPKGGDALNSRNAKEHGSEQQDETKTKKRSVSS